MSKLKAAILTAILGSSTAAMASPTLSWSADAQFSWGTTGAPVIRDHRTNVTQVAYQQQPSSSAYVKLATMLDLSSGRDLLRLGANARNADGLTLRTTYGQAFVRGIQVRYRNGSVKNIALNQWMTTRTPAINVELNGNRQIDSITIVGSPEGRFQYQVFASVDNGVELPQPPVYQPPVYQPPVYRGLSIGSDMNFLNTDGRRFITVGANKGTFGTLRLAGSSGTTYIQMVKVTFADGQEQFMGAVNKQLRAGEAIDLPLDGRGAKAIQQITVWTDSSGQMITGITGSFNASLL